MPESATVTTPSQEGFTPWLNRAVPMIGGRKVEWDLPHLNLIRRELAAVSRGECRNLMLLMPPQEGKSTQVTIPYPVWRMQREPGFRVGVCSYSQTIANRFSRFAQDVALDAGLPRGRIDQVAEWELANKSSWYSVGVGGSLTSRPLDLGIIDDPIKDRQEADSQVVRDGLWDWYLDVFRKRLQERSPQILIQTPWHEDDLHGRILNSTMAKEWRVVRLTALAEDDPEYPDPLGRAVGEALSVRHSKEHWEAEREIDPEGFQSLCQLRPTSRGGTLFERAWFELVDCIPHDARDIKRVRYWDLAATKGKTSAYTSGVLMARYTIDKVSKYIVEDVVRGRWNPAERNATMRQTAEMDEARYGNSFDRTWFEEQPAAAGVEVSDNMIAKFEGLRVRADRISGDKVLRSEPLQDAARGGQIKILRGDWNAAYLNEMASFPRGAYKDSVDSSSGAYSKLSRPGPVWAVSG